MKMTRQLLSLVKTTGLLSKGQLEFIDGHLGSFFEISHTRKVENTGKSDISFLLISLALIKTVSNADVAKQLLEAQAIYLPEYQQITDQISLDKLSELVLGKNTQIRQYLSPMSLLNIARTVATQLKLVVGTKDIIEEVWKSARNGGQSTANVVNIASQATGGLLQFFGSKR